MHKNHCFSLSPLQQWHNRSHYLCSFPNLPPSSTQAHNYIQYMHTLRAKHLKSLISNLQELETLIVQDYWFHRAAALSGHLQWWGKAVAAKSPLAFIRRLRGGNRLVRACWSLMNNWCRLMGKTGRFVVVVPVGQSLLKQLEITSRVASINNPNYCIVSANFLPTSRLQPSAKQTASKASRFCFCMWALYMCDLFHTDAHNRGDERSSDESHWGARERSSTTPQTLSSVRETAVLSWTWETRRKDAHQYIKVCISQTSALGLLFACVYGRFLLFHFYHFLFKIHSYDQLL